jgi:cell division protein FtsL
MKKVFIVLMILIVPLMFFLEIWGVFSNQKIMRDIEQLEKEQDEWLEKNKKLIAAIAVYSSPSRIHQVIKKDLDLEKIDPENIMEIVVTNNE